MAVKRSQHNRGDQTHGSPTARPWERRPDESAQAYHAFLTYRDLGPERTVGQAAAALGKSRGMLYRWSCRHQWRERAFRWDLEQQRETDAALRAARQQALERQVQDADRLQRLAMARLGKAVRRDPVSGEFELDSEVTLQDAVRVYRLGLEIERSLPPGPETAPAEEVGEGELRRMSAPTRVKPGELWQLGRHRLYCGDSLSPGALEKLLNDAKADLVLTDPPYGISYRSTLAKRGRRKRAIANDAGDEFESFLAKALPAIKGQMKRGAVLYWFAGGGGGEPVLGKAQLAIAQHFTFLNTIVWDKVDPGLGWRWRRSWEAIIEASVGKPHVWNGGTEARNVLRFAKAIPQADDHPTPKPVPLLEEIIRAAAPSRGFILDPFAGSGPTLIAAERTGRTCYAAELEPRYADIIVARWEALTGAQAHTQAPISDTMTRR